MTILQILGAVVIGLPLGYVMQGPQVCYNRAYRRADPGLEQPAGLGGDFPRGHVGQLAALHPTENPAARAVGR